MSLLMNPGYKNLKGFCNEIATMLNDIKALTNDGCGAMVDPEVMKEAGDVRDLGLKTVNLTYALFKLQCEIPKLVTPEAKSNAIEDLKKALELKHFALPVAIQDRMKAIVAPAQPAVAGAPALAEEA